MTKRDYCSRKNNEIKLRRLFILIILLNIRRENYSDWGIIHLVTPLTEILETLSLGKYIGNWTKGKIKYKPEDNKTISLGGSSMIFQAFKNWVVFCRVFWQKGLWNYDLCCLWVFTHCLSDSQQIKHSCIFFWVGVCSTASLYFLTSEKTKPILVFPFLFFLFFGNILSLC